MASPLGLASGYDETAFGVKGTGDILKMIFGSKPEVAGFEDINLGREQLDAILNNLKAFSTGDIQKLGNIYQDYMLSAYDKAIPGFKDILAKGGATTAQMLQTAGQELGGQVPQDVQDFVRRQSAFQNLGSGLAGSSMGAANMARNLGLTSLDMIGRGANLAGQAGNAAQRWAGIASGTILPTSSFLITPQQEAENTLSNRLIQRQIQQERFNVAAAPNPIAKGLSDIVMYLTGAYLGHGMGGGGGLPQAGNAPATQAASGSVFAPGGSDFGGAGAGASGAGAAQGSVSLGNLENLSFNSGGNPAPNENMLATPVGVPSGANYGTYQYPQNPYADLYGVNSFLTTY